MLGFFLGFLSLGISKSGHENLGFNITHLIFLFSFETKSCILLVYSFVFCYILVLIIIMQSSAWEISSEMLS